MIVSATNDIEPEMLNYYIEIIYWTPKELGIQLTFENPLVVSMGGFPDYIVMVPKNP